MLQGLAPRGRAPGSFALRAYYLPSAAGLAALWLSPAK